MWDPEGRATGCCPERTASKASFAGWVGFPAALGMGRCREMTVVWTAIGGMEWPELRGRAAGDEAAQHEVVSRSAWVYCMPYRGVPRASARWQTGAAGRRPGGVSCPWGRGPGGDHLASLGVAELACFKGRCNLFPCSSQCLLKVSNKNTLKIIKTQQ